MRIGILGLGIGGATAAAAMVQRGMDVTIFEQSSEVREVGAGVATWPNSIRLLNRLGIAEKLAQIGWPSDKTDVRRPDGTLLHAVSGKTYDDTPCYYFHRAELLQTIAACVPKDRIHLDRRGKSVSQVDDQVRLELENGEVHHFDMLLGADGIKSVAIDAVAASTPPLYSNLAAYRGLVPNEGDGKLDSGHLWTDREKFLVAFPVSGGKLINFTAVVPTPGKPEESWFMAGDKAQLHAEFADWDPVLRAIIAKVETTFRWGLYYRDPLANMVKGRIALLGDAAHPMLIHAGMGVGQAMEDAVALAAILEGATATTVEHRLKLYEDMRLTRCTNVQTASRRNAQFMHNAFPMEPGVDRPDRASIVDWVVDYDAELEVKKVLELAS